MPFDPTKPANNSQVSSAELRSQLTSLKTLIDACPTSAAMESYVNSNSAGPCDSVSPLGMTVSNPPTQAQVQAIANKIDELLLWLKRAI